MPDAKAFDIMERPKWEMPGNSTCQRFGYVHSFLRSYLLLRDPLHHQESPGTKIYGTCLIPSILQAYLLNLCPNSSGDWLERIKIVSNIRCAINYPFLRFFPTRRGILLILFGDAWILWRNLRSREVFGQKEVLCDACTMQIKVRI